MSMTQEERIAADARIRGLLGVNRKGSSPGAPFMAPRPGSLLAVTAGSKLPIDDEVYGLQMYGYGEVWGRPGLAPRERSFITLGLLTGTTQPDQLGIHVNNAINLGLTPEEICEMLVHVGAYSGVSTWHNGNNAVRYVFVERGILEPGSGAPYVSKPPTDQTARQAAAAIMMDRLGVGRIGLADDARRLKPLAGGPAYAASGQRLPIEDDIDQVQNEYLYGEVWSRPAISPRIRILITVAVLQALRINDELHAAINIALNLGVTADELHEVFLHAGVYSGLAGSRNAANVARDVFAQHGLLPTT